MNVLPQINGLLIIPHLRVQNANAISSPLTWGFPAMSAFIGVMQALERKLAGSIALQFDAVGVVCHAHQAQTSGDYSQGFHLSRNPVDKDGSTAAIVEEGRVHLEITLVFGVSGEALYVGDEERKAHAHSIAELLHGLRIAGGSIIPPLSGKRAYHPSLQTLGESGEDRALQFRQLRRHWLPGSVLVARDDLLHSHLVTLQQQNAEASLLDAWLDKSRLNHHPQKIKTIDKVTGQETETVKWLHSRGEGSGWIVPIPVGYGALSPLYPAGSVANARDEKTPFRFVESVYSLGEWISPHRLTDVNEILWYTHHDENSGLYRCKNDYAPPIATVQN